MIRQSLLRLTRASAPAQSARTFSAAAARMGEGDTGAPRSGGVAQSDSFQKREAASENKFIKEQEKQKLKELKARLDSQRAHLAELEKNIDEMSKEGGGEQN